MVSRKPAAGASSGARGLTLVTAQINMVSQRSFRHTNQGRWVVQSWPIGVFTSIDAGLGIKLEVARELQIPTIQLHAPHQSTRNEATAAKFLKRLAELEIKLTAVFGGFQGESYADIPTVERTVGLVPVDTRQNRLQEMKEIADFARQLYCDVVALHLGFVPHEQQSPSYGSIVSTTQELCDYCANCGQSLHLETGQETADSLIRFMDDVGRPNLFVNFDPANMILYGTGEPIEALRKIGDRVRSVHCKDALWAQQPGQEWGTEVPLGQGDVDVQRYLETLLEIGYEGPLTIEREIPQEPERQKLEIGHAVDVLNRIKSSLSLPS